LGIKNRYGISCGENIQKSSKKYPKTSKKTSKNIQKHQKKSKKIKKNPKWVKELSRFDRKIWFFVLFRWLWLWINIIFTKFPILIFTLFQRPLVKNC
jgi:hypothetical protein